MIEDKHKFSWYCLGDTATGASHSRTGLDNQDAICWWPGWPEQSGSGLPLIVAVSDGHGSAKSFRSRKGSVLAVEIATQEIKEFFQLSEPEKSVDFKTNFAFINDEAKRRLPQVLVKKWQETVKQHRQENQFTDDEWRQLEEKEGPAARQLVEYEQSTLAYGATLLTVLVTESFILYLQLGDGDILCVDSNGNTTRPFAKDARLIANETTSLCMNKAWQEVQIRLVPYSDNPPALILLATDGYSNSFSSEEDFLKIGQEYRTMIRERGMKEVKNQLKNILEETTQKGSGDDITLGIIRRIEKDDQDYLISTVDTTASDVKQLKSNLGEHMAKSQEKMSNIDNELHRLHISDDKLKKSIEGLRRGLMISFSLSFIGIVLGSYAVWRQLFHSPTPTTTASTPPALSPSNPQLPVSTLTPTPSVTPVQNSPLSLVFTASQSQPIQLSAGVKLYKELEVISALQTNTNSQAIAEVIAPTKNDQSSLKLKNLSSNETWETTLRGAPPKVVKAKETIGLEDGLTINFGSVECEVKRTPT